MHTKDDFHERAERWTRITFGIGALGLLALVITSISSGTLFVGRWHRSVVRLNANPATFWSFIAIYGIGIVVCALLAVRKTPMPG